MLYSVSCPPSLLADFWGEKMKANHKVVGGLQIFWCGMFGLESVVESYADPVAVGEQG